MSLLLAVVLYTVALPPWGYWSLIFFVPTIWARLIRSEEFGQSRWKYGKTYLSSLLFWLTATFWICFPHPLTSLGWVALSAYLAIYLPLFIGLCRRITARANLPIFLVAPPVWVAMEWLRNHIFGGFSMAALEHAFYRVPMLIQAADLGGQYLIGFFIVLFGCCLEQTLRVESKPRENLPKVAFYLGVGSVALVLLYAYVRTDLSAQPKSSKEISSEEPPIRVAVLQGNMPVTLTPPENWHGKTFEQFAELSRKAVEKAAKEGKRLDLIVWGETVYPYPLVDFEPGFVLEQWREHPEEHFETIRKETTRRLEELPLGLARSLDTNLLLGAGVIGYKKEDSVEEDGIRYNSAVLVDPVSGTLGPRYDKIHLVMFGEYVPFADYLPEKFPLKTLCQTAGRGTEITAIPVPLENHLYGEAAQENPPRKLVHIAPNICFECLVPHLIRRQVQELKRRGEEPEILVNLSNVGWFFFTSEIDFQLAAQVFRAVENRKPYLTATNCGLSAFIDGSGRIKLEGVRKEATFLNAEIHRDLRSSFYSEYGDVFAYGCMICLCALFFRYGKRKIE